MSITRTPSLQEVLHLLRNPWGHDESQLRAARLAAADMLEAGWELQSLVRVKPGGGRGFYVHGSFSAVKRCQALAEQNEDLRRQLAEARSDGHFNGLTPAELERLALIAEEASESIQAAMKVVRHGYRSGHPDYGDGDNRDHLERELGQLQAVVNLACQNDDLSGVSMMLHAEAKIKNVGQYLHHNTTEGVKT